MSRALLTGNQAAAHAATLAARANRTARGFGAGVYPITPQTEAIEQLCAASLDKGFVVRVESEHSAMGVCIGASLSGARSFTASSANGLAYMTENVFVAAYYRLPIVMMAVNRALGPPWNIWLDHGDSLALRDAGWIQLYVEDVQAVLDCLLCAFRLGEDPRVLLPVMVCQDAFVLSHTATQIDVPEQADVDRFLPTLCLPHRVTGAVRAIGQLDNPRELQAHRRMLTDAMGRVPEVMGEIQEAFHAQFGRRPFDPIACHRVEDAEVVLVAMGTTAVTARSAVDEARARGLRAGALGVRAFRPLCEGAIRTALRDARAVAVVDRDVCPGLGGILWGELRSLAAPGACVQSYLAGLGGGDVRPEHLGAVLDDVVVRREAGPAVFVEVAS